MSHLLDNMIWNALTTGNKNIAVIDGNVGSYQENIAPFVGLKQLTDQNLEKLYEFIPPGRKVVISYTDGISLNNDKWETIQQMHCCQMVYEVPVTSFETGNSHLIVGLTEEHVPQMLELTALTKPGPFLSKTILFGNYFGIFIDGRLAAMTGQRMHPVPYLEVSAVCAHPDFQGKGYAKAVMLHVMKIIIDNSFTPFLHVLSNNSTAIGLYESIGFRVRRNIYIDVIKRM